MKNVIKKIVALSTGAFFMGATMCGAMAATDLANFPKPLFINAETGVFDGIFVIGDSAATEDVIGVTGIAAAIQAAAIKKVAVGSTTTTLTGESKKISTSTNTLELYENPRGITSAITSTDLPKALADGTISNEYGDFTYSQTIYIPQSSMVKHVADPDDSNSVLKEYYVINSTTTNGADAGYKYKVAFSPAIKSDHHSTGTYLEDIKNKKITLLGKEYTILKADHTATASIDLTFMGGAIRDTMNEGETKTYTLNSKDYEITVSYIGGTTVKAKFKVNGEVTDLLADAETFKLTDGTEIGVIELMENEGTEGNPDQVDFTLGADKIRISDAETNVTTNSTVSIGSEDMGQVTGDITTSSDAGLADNADVYISSFEIKYAPSSDLYIPVDGKASVVADKIESVDHNFFGNFDFEYLGMDYGTTEAIKLVATNQYYYSLKFKNKAGVEYTAPVFTINATTASTDATVFPGKYDGSAMKDLILDENQLVTDEEYFIVDKNDYSHIMQYKSIIPSKNVVKITDIGNSDSYDVTYAASGNDLSGDLNLDGNTYKINVSADATGATLRVDLDGDGTWNEVKSVNLTTNLGLRIRFPGDAGARRGLYFMSEKQDDGSTRDYITANFQANGDGKIDINESAWAFAGGGDTSVTASESGSYLYKAMTRYGILVQDDRKSSGTTQNEVTITYPDDQAAAKLYVTGGVTTTTESAGSYTEQVQPIPATATKLASEVADYTAQNMILVGGPCANTVAMEVMGATSADCASGFEAGKAKIKLYEMATGKIAMLVAGYDAIDTRRAAKVVANYKDYAASLTGTEVVVTTLTDTPTVAQPVVETVVPEGNATG